MGLITPTIAFAAVTLTAGAGDQTSSVVDLRQYKERGAGLQIINGGTGPTVAAKIQAQVCCEDAPPSGSTKWFSYGGELRGGVVAATTYDMPVDFGQYWTHCRFLAGENTVQDVVVNVIVGKVKAVGEF